MRALVIASVVFLVAFAPAPFPRARRAEAQEPLRGVWLVKRLTWLGREIGGIYRADGLKFSTNERLTIAADGLTIPNAQKQRHYVRRWTLRADRAGGTVDLIPAEDGREAVAGRYRLEGDQLTLSLPTSAGETRPATLEQGALIMVLERAR